MVFARLLLPGHHLMIRGLSIEGRFHDRGRDEVQKTKLHEENVGNLGHMASFTIKKSPKTAFSSTNKPVSAMCLEEEPHEVPPSGDDEGGERAGFAQWP